VTLVIGTPWTSARGTWTGEPGDVGSDMLDTLNEVLKREARCPFALSYRMHLLLAALCPETGVSWKLPT
jgi:hypothetical protein